jgi:hypothetical protein
MQHPLLMVCVVDYFDPPVVLDAAVTAIPGSGSFPVQVVSSLAGDVCAVEVRDGIGTEFIGVYRGAPGSEVLVCVVGGPGNSKIEARIPGASRVSLRSMNSTAITSGSLCVMFLGV